jgi:hypothetical protein
MLNRSYQSYSNEEMDEFRQTSDSLADELIQNLYDSLPPKEIGRLFQHFLTGMKDVQYGEVPEVMQEYFNANQIYPDWIDWHKIAQAESLFLSMGPEYATALLFRSLPVGYVAANTVKVLTSTGYLAADVKTGTAKRLLETTQFVIDVMGKGALKKDQRGLKSILKVRFIHAMVRYHLQKHEWDRQRYGIPINQEDMAGTILTFGVGAIIGLERLNVKISSSEKDALVHFWSVVGHFIGVDSRINPTNYLDGKKLYLQILERQAVKSEDGLILTKALANFAKGFIAVDEAPMVQEHFIRYLIGNQKYSDIIGLSKPESLKEILVFNGLIGFMKTMNGIRGLPFTDTISKPFSRILATKLLAYFHAEFEMKIDFPQEIIDHWGLKEATPKTVAEIIENLVQKTFALIPQSITNKS